MKLTLSVLVLALPVLKVAAGADLAGKLRTAARAHALESNHAQ